MWGTDLNCLALHFVADTDITALSLQSPSLMVRMAIKVGL